MPNALPLPRDPDPALASLLAEFEAQMTALNEAWHPVRPADPRMVAALERRVEELREEIGLRRKKLAAG